MKTNVSTPIRLLALTTLLAFVLTATMPFYCSTGWCCAKHASEQTADTPSCCAEETELALTTPQLTGSCCASESTSPTTDNSCDSGCPTGCCKIAANSFTLTTSLSIAYLQPISTLTPQTVQDTGVELADYIPQPPRVLIA